MIYKNLVLVFFYIYNLYADIIISYNVSDSRLIVKIFF